LLFHDVVYTAGAPDGLNERLSALFLKDVAPRMGTFDLVRAMRFIHETADHKPTCDLSAVVQDLDLSSLAGSPLEFCVTNELVWLENRHLLDAEDRRRDFDTRRLAFLLKLAESGPLFRSRALAHLEDAARENLEELRQTWMQRYGSQD
jgi:predicted metal-dependent HD superfamily phosphohydrolase